MLSERGRLLLLLILLSVVAAAGSRTALADGKEKTAAPVVLSSPACAVKPPATATSGEPDVGQTPRYTSNTGRMFPAPRDGDERSQGSHRDDWLHWILRMWVNRCPGAR
jgi:hypothetical protein